MRDFLDIFTTFHPIPYIQSLTWLFRVLWIVWGGLFVFLVFFTTMHADTRMYKPPEELGNIYFVIDKTWVKKIINVSIQWGNYRANRKIDLTEYKGCIVFLRHTKKDSLTLEVNTDGNIIEGPDQGALPAWNNLNNYVRVDL